MNIKNTNMTMFMPFSYNIEYCNNTVVIQCYVSIYTENLHTVYFRSAYLHSVGEANVTRSSKHVHACTPVFCQWLVLCLSTHADAWDICLVDHVTFKITCRNRCNNVVKIHVIIHGYIVTVHQVDIYIYIYIYD